MALIYVNNRLIQKVSLAKPRIIHYEKMIFEVNNNQIHVKASNCPEQICVHRGWINKRGQIIVCGPNHLLIEIDGSSEGKVYAPAL